MSLDIQTTQTLLRMISGARYSGVPQSVHVRPFTRLAKPKSVTYKIHREHKMNVIKSATVYVTL